MKKYIIAICLVILPALVFAGVPPHYTSTIVYDTVDNLPSSPTTGDLAGVNDGNTASDCTVGSGSNWNLCVYNGSAWVVQGDGTGAAGLARLQPLRLVIHRLAIKTLFLSIFCLGLW